MKPKYYTSNGGDVAVIGKSGSSAIGKALLLAAKPNYTIISASGDQAIVDKLSNGPSVWHTAEKTDTPTEPLVPVRDPVERFRSACAQDGVTDVDSHLDKLEAGERPAGTFHYLPTSAWLVDGARLYKFPEQVGDMASALNLAEIPQVNDNESNNIAKPDLTQDQLSRVQALYADDITLYESIVDAGQTYMTPPVPATDGLKALKIRELETARFQAEIAGTTVAALGGSFVRTDKETQSELGKALALLTIDPAFEIDWKFPDGTIVHLAKAQIDAVAQAVFTHVQATRTTYKDKAALVEVASTKDELDAITW